MRAFFEVVILRRFRADVDDGVWGTAGRRYASNVALVTGSR